MSSRLYPPFEHEYEVRKVVRGMLGGGRGGVFVDVGANLGVWVVDLAPLFERVYAFEPWPEYAEQLRLNLGDYGVGNVEVVEACAWDFSGQVLIGIGREDDNKVLPNQSGLGVPTVGFNGSVVKAVRLDDCVGGPFRLLKVDVEGNGLHVLRGAERLLGESRGIVALEVHNHGESHGTWQYLSDLGWRLDRTLEARQGPNWYHAHKVYVK